MSWPSCCVTVDRAPRGLRACSAELHSLIFIGLLVTAGRLVLGLDLLWRGGTEAQRVRQRGVEFRPPRLAVFTRDRRRARFFARSRNFDRSTFRPPSCCSEGSPSEPPSELRASPRSPPGTAAASAPNSAPRLRWPPNQCTTISWCARREKQSAPSLVKALLAHTAAPMLSCANCECPRHPHRPHSRCQPCS